MIMDDMQSAQVVALPKTRGAMSNTRSMPSRSNTPDTKEATTTRKSHAIFIIAVIIFGVSIVNVASIRKYIVERGAEPTLSNTVSRASYFAESGAELAIGTDIASRSSSVAIKSTVNDTTDNQVTASSVAVKSTVNDTCPEGQFYMQDRVDTDLSDHPDIRLIPNVLYQTSKDRCLTNAFNKGIDSWRDAIPGLLNVFHDDAAMDELLSHSKWEADFPNLKYFLKCANHVNVPVLKADVWRYLIVWENGGIYADLDVKPEYKFNSSTIHDDDDSFFTIDGSTGKFKIINAMILLYFLVTMLTLLIEISVRLALNSSTYELIVIFILFRNNFAVFFCCFAKASYPLQCSSRSN